MILFEVHTDGTFVRAEIDGQEIARVAVQPDVDGPHAAFDVACRELARRALDHWYKTPSPLDHW
jgi:hypothetical protein